MNISHRSPYNTEFLVICALHFQSRGSAIVPVSSARWRSADFYFVIFKNLQVLQYIYIKLLKPSECLQQYLEMTKSSIFSEIKMTKINITQESSDLQK